MRYIVIILGLFFISCQKETVTPKDNGTSLRCVDITPDIYSFMAGKWTVCDADPSNKSTYDFRVHNSPYDSLNVDSLILNKDTFIYKLARDYNVDIIKGYRLRDSLQYFEVWEIRADNSFWMGPFRLCR